MVLPQNKTDYSKWGGLGTQAIRNIRYSAKTLSPEIMWGGGLPTEDPCFKAAQYKNYASQGGQSVFLFGFWVPIFWVAVQELEITYYIGETLLFAIYTQYGNLI